MSEFQRNPGQDLDEDRLPWLEPVDDFDEEDGILLGRLISAVVVGLVALGLVIGGIFWLRNRDTATGNGTLIAAPEGPIKEKPGEAGGMEVDGAGGVAYDASVGKDVNSTIDLTALPEAPVTDRRAIGTTELPASTAAQAPAAKPAPAPATALAQSQAKIPAAKTPPPAPAKPVPAPKPLLPAPEPTQAAAPTGGAIQLGAFSSAALANKAWSSLAGRFGFLSGLNHSVNNATVGGKTLYRLRAEAGGQAASICAKLKVAGEACSVVN